jgi:hypothetical protein
VIAIYKKDVIAMILLEVATGKTLTVVSQYAAIPIDQIS